MTFDTIVGNPPYHEPSESADHSSKQWKVKIYMRIIKLATDIASENGLVLMVTPSGWMHLTNPYHRYICDLQLRYANIDSPGLSRKYFPGVGSTFSILLLENTPKYEPALVQFEDRIAKYDLTKKRPICRQHFDTTSFSLLDRLIAEPRDKQFSELYYRSSRKSEILAKDHTIAINRSSDLWWHASELPEKNAGIYWRQCSSRDEAVRLLSVLNSSLYRWALNAIRSGMAVVSTINWLRMPPLDRAYTDAELYEYFSLTEAEIELVEEAVG